MSATPYFESVNDLPHLPENIGDSVEYGRLHPKGSYGYVLTRTSPTEWTLKRSEPAAGVGILTKDGASWYTFDGRSTSGSVHGADESWRFLLSKMF